MPIRDFLRKQRRGVSLTFETGPRFTLKNDVANSASLSTTARTTATLAAVTTRTSVSTAPAARAAATALALATSSLAQRTATEPIATV